MNQQRRVASLILSGAWCKIFQSGCPSSCQPTKSVTRFHPFFNHYLTPEGTALLHLPLFFTAVKCNTHTTRQLRTLSVALWHSGNGIERINKVTPCRAWLVLGWMTILSQQTTSVFHQATKANSASYPQQDGT